VQLHEEYIGRHNLDVPVVRYDNHSNVFLKSKETPFRWRIFSIRWHDGGYHPGFFEATYTTPSHNGCETGDLLNHLMRPKRLYWEEYEDWILTMTGTLKEEHVAVSAHETLLANWQIFLVMYDLCLARDMGEDFFVAVGGSICDDLGMPQRLDCFSTATAHLYAHLPSVYESWKYQVMPLSNTHSEWLEKLINE
jgi:hypothetical protein